MTGKGRTPSPVELLRPNSVYSLASVLCVGVFISLSIVSMHVWNQHHRLTTYNQIAAKVVGKSIAVNDDSKPYVYMPVINYTYTIDGRAYSSHKRLPFPDQYGTRLWAQEILDQYTVGESITAWRSPNDPADVYLEHKIIFDPYLWLLLSMVMFNFFMAPLFFGSKNQLSPSVKIQWLFGLTMAWNVVGLFSLAHYRLMKGEMGGGPGWALFVYFALNALPLWELWILRQAVKRPEIPVELPPDISIPPP